MKCRLCECEGGHDAGCIGELHDRIARLEAELAEARRHRAEDFLRHRVGCEMYMGKPSLSKGCTCGVILLNLEIAAHARKQAKLAEARQLADEYRQERDAARALLDKAQRERAEARRERDAAQADAVEMREALQAARISMGAFANGKGWTHAEDEVWRMMADALDSNTGRALAKRVPLWRELERIGDEIKGTGGTNPEDGPFSRLRGVLCKLAALDEKK